MSALTRPGETLESGADAGPGAGMGELARFVPVRVAGRSAVTRDRDHRATRITSHGVPKPAPRQQPALVAPPDGQRPLSTGR
jgi:hypothetical protein